MLTVVATFVMAPDIEVAWDEVWPRVCDACRQQAGFRQARLMRDTNSPRRYMVHSEWEDREHANRFVRTAGLLWLLRGLDFLAEHPTIMYLDAVADVAP